MSASKLCLFGTGLLRSHRPLAARPPVLLTKTFVPQPLQFRPLCSSVAVETLSSQTAESPQQKLVHHPWPEWVTFVDNLMTKSYLIGGSPPAGGGEEGDSIASQFYNNMNLLKDPCVSFARDRYDLFKSLSLEDIQAVVECGCPNLLRKAVNSSKRLRAFLKLDEEDVCASCNLRDSCDRAYVLLQESEATARTVDVVRILLAYALDPLVIKGDQKRPGRELAEQSARKLLAKLVELSETSSAPALPKLALQASSSKEKPSRSKDRKERKNQSVMAERRGDWTCPKCHFSNFAKNNVCRKCNEACPSPTQAGGEEVELPKGDWICSDCHFVNFSRNVECMKCRAPGPEKPKIEMKPGDWECQDCQFINFSKNAVCLKCQAQGPEKRKPEMKPGDWKCQDCQFVNFSRNAQCLKCQAPGPEKSGAKVEMKKGDWNCEKCSYMNFAKNVKCFRCEERRPKSRPGDWHCPKCDYLNYSGKLKCGKCDNKLSKGMETEKTDYEEQLWNSPV